MRLKHLDDYIEGSTVVEQDGRYMVVNKWKTIPGVLSIVRVPLIIWEDYQRQGNAPFPMQPIDRDWCCLEMIVVRADHPLRLLPIAWYWHCRFWEFMNGWLLFCMNRLGLAATPRGAYMRWADLKVCQWWRSRRLKR